MKGLHRKIAEKPTSSAEELWSSFKEGLQSSIVENIPHKTTRRRAGQPWITTDIRKLINQRDRKYKQMKKKGTFELKTDLLHLRSKVQRKIRYCTLIKSCFGSCRPCHKYSDFDFQTSRNYRPCHKYSDFVGFQTSRNYRPCHKYSDFVGFQTSRNYRPCHKYSDFVGFQTSRNYRPCHKYSDFVGFQTSRNYRPCHKYSDFVGFQTSRNYRPCHKYSDFVGFQTSRNFRCDFFAFSKCSHFKFRNICSRCNEF
ncbi:hypothetical protein ACOMHN_058085 [Nucella lapillus]